MHPFDRLRRDRPCNTNLLFRILHLKFEPPNHPRNGATQLRPRKVLPDTRPLPMQKGDLREICGRSSVVVDRGLTVLVCIDPTFGDKFIAIVSPEFRAAVDRIRTQDDPRALGNVLACNSRVANRFANRGGDGWIQAQNLLADAVKERHAFQVVGGNVVTAAGDALTDFSAEALLDFRILTEEIARPG